MATAILLFVFDREPWATPQGPLAEGLKLVGIFGEIAYNNALTFHSWHPQYTAWWEHKEDALRTAGHRVGANDLVNVIPGNTAQMHGGELNSTGDGVAVFLADLPMPAAGASNPTWRRATFDVVVDQTVGEFHALARQQLHRRPPVAHRRVVQAARDVAVQRLAARAAACADAGAGVHRAHDPLGCAANSAVPAQYVGMSQYLAGLQVLHALTCQNETVLSRGFELPSPYGLQTVDFCIPASRDSPS